MHNTISIYYRDAYLDLDNSSYDMHPKVFEVIIMLDQGLMWDGMDDGLMECARYNPLGPSRPGILGAIEITLLTEGIYNWYINVHYVKHFTNSLLGTFGSGFIEPDSSRMNGYDSTYEVTPTKVEYLKQRMIHAYQKTKKTKLRKLTYGSALSKITLHRS